MYSNRLVKLCLYFWVYFELDIVNYGIVFIYLRESILFINSLVELIIDLLWVFLLKGWLVF